jgi:hypothetical protein
MVWREDDLAFLYQNAASLVTPTIPLDRHPGHDITPSLSADGNCFIYQISSKSYITIPQTRDKHWKPTVDGPIGDQEWQACVIRVPRQDMMPQMHDYIIVVKTGTTIRLITCLANHDDLARTSKLKDCNFVSTTRYDIDKREEYKALFLQASLPSRIKNTRAQDFSADTLLACARNNSSPDDSLPCKPCAQYQTMIAHQPSKDQIIPDADTIKQLHTSFLKDIESLIKGSLPSIKWHQYTDNGAPKKCYQLSNNNQLNCDIMRFMFYQQYVGFDLDNTEHAKLVSELFENSPLSIDNCVSASSTEYIKIPKGTLCLDQTRTDRDLYAQHSCAIIQASDIGHYNTIYDGLVKLQKERRAPPIDTATHIANREPPRGGWTNNIGGTESTRVAPVHSARL